jgi:hypothetical protein
MDCQDPREHSSLDVALACQAEPATNEPFPLFWCDDMALAAAIREEIYRAIG